MRPDKPHILKKQHIHHQGRKNREENDSHKKPAMKATKEVNSLVLISLCPQLIENLVHDDPA